MRGSLSPARSQTIRESFARQGFLLNFGAEMAALELGHCVLKLAFGPQTVQQHGYFPGGLIGALGDVAGGYAAMSVAEVGDVLTIDYTINFLRPGRGDFLEATGIVLRPGRTMTATRVDVHVHDGGERKLVAALQQTIMHLPE